MKEYTIVNDNSPDLSFTGERVAAVSSRTYNSQSWEELDLYKTEGGKYICARETHSLWENCDSTYEAEVKESIDRVPEFFGYSGLAKELYEEAGINSTRRIS